MRSAELGAPIQHEGEIQVVMETLYSVFGVMAFFICFHLFFELLQYVEYKYGRRIGRFIRTYIKRKR